MGIWGYLLLGTVGLGVVLLLRPNWFPWLLLLGPLGLLAWWTFSSDSGFAPDTDREEDLDDPEPHYSHDPESHYSHDPEPHYSHDPEPLWEPYSSDDDPLS